MKHCDYWMYGLHIGLYSKSLQKGRQLVPQCAQNAQFSIRSGRTLVIVRGQWVWRSEGVIHCSSITQMTLNDNQSIKQENYINLVQDFQQRSIQYNENTNSNKKILSGTLAFFSTITYVTAIVKWLC